MKHECPQCGCRFSAAILSERPAASTEGVVIDERDEEPDGCLHGVPWCDPCWECYDEEDRMDCGVY